jgi:ATP synthase protein I
VWQFTGSALVGVGAGYWVDKHFGVSPWGLVIGGTVGSAAGFYAFVRTTNRLMDAQKKTRK